MAVAGTLLVFMCLVCCVFACFACFVLVLVNFIIVLFCVVFGVVLWRFVFCFPWEHILNTNNKQTRQPKNEPEGLALCFSFLLF